MANEANALNLDPISMVQKERWLTHITDSRWGTCGNEISRFQRYEGTQKSKELSNSIDHIGGVVVLDHLSVCPFFQEQGL